VTSKDLTSFAKQMENVANQIKDGATAGRLTSLVAKIRRLVSSNILPLETRRVCIQYRIINSLSLQRHEKKKHYFALSCTPVTFLHLTTSKQIRTMGQDFLFILACLFSFYLQIDSIFV
jgi:hypothetical protein